MRVSQKSRDRIAKLVRLLGSDVDGEVIATARALQRALSADKRDLHDLASMIVGTPTWGRSAPAERLAWLRTVLRHNRIDDAERATLRALGVKLKADPALLRPDPADKRLYNRWVTKLFEQGARP